MAEDSAVRIDRKARYALASVAVVYVLSALAIAYWGLPSLDAYYKSRPIDTVARTLVFFAVLWLLLPLLPMGTYLFRYGRAVARSGQHPLPGWRFIRPQWQPGTTMTGRRAAAFGLGAFFCGLTMLAAFVAVGGYFLYLLFVK